MTRAAQIVALAVAACAGPPPVENPSPFDEDDPAAQPGTRPPVVVEEPAEPEAPALPETIEREALHRVLAAGPGAYAESVMIEAVVDGKRLHGWRVVRWEVPWSGLAAGEVVLDVNGFKVVRPDDLIKLWESLWDVSEIAIRVERDGAAEIRRFAVR